MSTSEQQFRSVAFGGFHKQDVLNFIENATKEHANKTETMEKELGEVKAAKATLETEKAELTAKGEAAATELEEAAAAIEWANGELEKKNARLAELEEENFTLKARVKELEPDADAYRKVKDRTAGIELEAHCRAQAAEAAAQEHIQKSKAGLEQWVRKVQLGYDRLRTDVDATISHADGELERVGKTLAGISAEFSDHDAELETLLSTFREGQPPQVPAPLKVDGE